MKIKSDLSVYEDLFNVDNFVFGTPVTLRHIKLHKDGFQPIVLKYKSDGCWYGLAYVSGAGDERWQEHNKEFVENYLNSLPEDVFLEELF